jgi:hypothetical protein
MPAGSAQRAVELELQDVREEVARVGTRCRHVVLGAGSKSPRSRATGGAHALVLLAQLPPGLRCTAPAPISPEKTFQRHWSTSRPKGRKATLSSAMLHQQAEVAVASGAPVDQADLLRYSGVTDSDDGVAQRLVEAVVGAVAIEERLLL